MQRVCEDGSESVCTKVVEVIELACEGVEAKHRNVTLSDRNTDTEAKLVEGRTVGVTMREQLPEAERRIKALKTQLDEGQLALEKSAGGSSRTEANLQAQEVAVKKSFNANRACVDCFELEFAAEAKKKQQLLANCQETSGTASRQLAEHGELL